MRAGAGGAVSRLLETAERLELAYRLALRLQQRLLPRLPKRPGTGGGRADAATRRLALKLLGEIDEARASMLR